MCGRFNLISNLNALLQRFAIEDSEITDWQPRYNIAPTQDVAAVRLNDSDHRELVKLRWGLIPSWAKDAKIAYSTINARADTVAEKPAFRSAFKKRRCLIVADGYYEWKTTGKDKQPYLYELGHPFAMAGLWERWNDVESCTIITTDANEVASAVHNRMPVILDEASYQLWMDPAVQERERLEPLLVPYAGKDLTVRPVSKYVSNARNQGPACVEPV